MLRNEEFNSKSYFNCCYDSQFNLSDAIKIYDGIQKIVEKV